MPGRRIIFDPDCDIAATALGGYQRIGRSLDGYWDSLLLAPRDFPRKNEKKKRKYIKKER